MNEILVLKMSSKVYGSLDYYADKCADALKVLGVSVRVFDFKREGTEGLEKLLNVPFRAILDFNSGIPKMKVNGKPFLDYLEGPFYNWILDHPLYNHDTLKSVTANQNFHVLCLDEGHVDYIRANYPDIKDVSMLSLASVVRETPTEWENKQNNLVFCGTYVEPDMIMQSIIRSPKATKVSTIWIINYMNTHLDTSVETAARLYLDTHPESEFHNRSFPLFLQMNFLADTYIRASFREKALNALADARLPIHIYGSFWESYKKNHPYATLNVHPNVTYEKSIQIQAQHKLVLNTMPWFKRGAHDRIFTSMAEKSLCLTDSSAYLDMIFTDGKDIAGYQINDFNTLTQKAEYLLSHPNRAGEIALKGYENVKKNHQWIHRMETWLAALEQS